MLEKLVYSIAIASVLISLCACDSRQEDQRKHVLGNRADNLEERAEVVRDCGEEKADTLEERDPGMNSKETKDAMDAARKDSENKADALEDEADKVRAQKD